MFAMKIMSGVRRCALFPTIAAASALVWASEAPAEDQPPLTRLPAFPGAEGFGAYTPGGRGGTVIAVTNLKDYVPGKENPIPGSFRAACDTKGPRIIIFHVGGLIELKSPLYVREPFVTIAGQTAPGDGICLTKYDFSIFDTHDAIVRYLRFRPGDEAKTQLDALTDHGSPNVIFDHCSTSWGNDEVLSVTRPGTTNVTVQWCLISESLNRSYHPKGDHGYGSLLLTDGNVTFHHNLYAHHRRRNPHAASYGKPPGILLDFRNNLIYNWGTVAGTSGKEPVRMNYVGNYLKAGPSTRDPGFAFTVGGEATALFAARNYLVGGGEKNRDNWLMIRLGRGAKRAQPFPVAPVNTDSPKDAYMRILENAGATLPVRDAIDRRLIAEVRTGRGRIIDSQTDVGGWPAYKQAPPPADGDNDAMPDYWETEHGLNPADPSDNNQDQDGDGYTNIEEFLNRTDPGQKDIN